MNKAYADGRAGIDAALVRRLIATQFPQWRSLPVTPVEVDGWDNRTYRLGDHMSVRLPTHESYTPAVDKEHRWLPVLAPLLPLPIPVPLAKGLPGESYPFKWSVRQWLDGQTASHERIDNLSDFAISLAEFIRALQGIDTTGGPPAGAHSFHRGAALSHYDAETRRSLAVLKGQIDTTCALEVWRAALAAPWAGPPVWFHGDIASGNLLVRNGELAAVIDFGTSGIGDPACDLVIAWTLFHGDSREAFRERVRQDEATWARARGWALWKALISLADIDADDAAATTHRAVIEEVLSDHTTAAPAQPAQWTPPQAATRQRNDGGSTAHTPRRWCSIGAVRKRAEVRVAGRRGEAYAVAEPRPAEPETWLERYRAELTGYCYRMLGSAFEAEDAVQETLVRAWQGFDRFEGRSAVRSWLYRIATNVCLNMLKSGQRRARPVDLAPPSEAGAPFGAALPETTWVEPIPDNRLLPAGVDPADMVVARETISLAFVAALQHLTPQQRAVLIMRDVLALRASEVAEALGTTVTSVKSTLQRARAAIAAREVTATEPYRPADAAQRTLLARFVDAFERYDLDALVALLHEDATMSMPPFSWWLCGRVEIRRAILGGEGACRGARLVPTVANGSPAFGQYRPGGSGGGYEPFALQVIDVAAGRIVGITTFLDAARLFPLFELPLRLSG